MQSNALDPHVLLGHRQNLTDSQWLAWTGGSHTGCAKNTPLIPPTSIYNRLVMITRPNRYWEEGQVEFNANKLPLRALPT